MEKLLKEQWTRLKNMEIKSEQKHLIISPRKVRPVADVIKKLSVQKAIDSLPFIKKRDLLLKVIKSAVANALQKGVSVTDLKFKEIQIGEGPRLKRGQPVSRGRWHPIKKRMSHIKVILETIKKEQVVEKEKVKTDESKKEVIKEVKATTKVVKKGAKNGTKS
ncbi:MAG: 50S ribosomal protein L22 [Berkelbacteria bacterium GW2011_GWA1_36_9]|uniref:50S ribosomal protein L22 n=1 Tax=Berkelbacteria bacterium GW2011_GWA1_36_9 TaxID=1618331 RepID=A0A0G0FH81_9BACT|nr:MAG: 50S ribosomal protein L22 [Berkelbacteria bacterium GW2011_GWA1_36_9]